MCITATSYSTQEVCSDPSWLKKVLEHSMIQPGLQAWLYSSLPSRCLLVSKMASPAILGAPSKRPFEKLRVGNPPASFKRLISTAAVSYTHLTLPTIYSV